MVFCKPKLIQEAERQSAHEIAGGSHFVVEEVVAGGAACVSGLVRFLCKKGEREDGRERENSLDHACEQTKGQVGQQNST